MKEEITKADRATQRMRIMRHLKAGKSITQLEALRDYGIMRLASRISELKKRGEPILKTTREGVNKYGETYRYAEYYLKAGG